MKIMKLCFKIQSMSDIITNSSTEVFTIYNDCDLDTIKKIVNSILNITSSDYKFDDLFDIRLVLSDYAIAEIMDNPSKYGVDDIEYLEPFLNTCPREVAGTLEKIWCQDWRESWPPFYEGFEINAKIPEAKEAARCLSRLDDIFETDYRY